MSFILRAWERWQIINKVNGDFIAQVALFLFYYTICATFAFGAWIVGRLRVTRDPLKRKQPTTWTDRLISSATIDDARQQF